MRFERCRFWWLSLEKEICTKHLVLLLGNQCGTGAVKRDANTPTCQEVSVSGRILNGHHVVGGILIFSHCRERAWDDIVCLLNTHLKL